MDLLPAIGRDIHLHEANPRDSLRIRAKFSMARKCRRCACAFIVAYADNNRRREALLVWLSSGIEYTRKLAARCRARTGGE
jgi:hypothetical protein